MIPSANAGGVEWIVDARGCDADLLAHRATLEALVAGIVSDLSLRVVGAPMWHVFPGAGGVTGICLLAESHLALHSFPEHRSLCLNLFCCRPRLDWDFAGRLGTLLGATDVEVRRVERRYADVPAEAK